MTQLPDIKYTEEKPWPELYSHASHALEMAVEQGNVELMQHLKAQFAGVSEFLRSKRNYGEQRAQISALERRAEYHIGVWLKKNIQHEGGTVEQADSRLPKEISRDDSSRWQKMAVLPEQELETVLANRDSKPITQATVLRKAREWQRQKSRETDAAWVSETPALLDGTKGVYSTIVADPPWDWGDEGDQDQLGRARPIYETMSIGDLEALPVEQVSAPNAHLYLWITNRSLPKGFNLLNKWGFRYITMLTWAKLGFGMGNYFRGSTEQVLFGVRGSLPLSRHNVGTWFQWPRTKEHSQKPEEFFELVESCSPGPYLEMFARRQRENWTCWGVESQETTASATS